MNQELGLIEKATRIAVIAHVNQKRKNDGSPYVVHPFIVAMKLVKYNFSDAVIAAALVHDVLEDTDVTEQELRDKLGNEVVDMVKMVTNDDTLSWRDKKIKYVETVRNGSDEAKAISIADKIHNMEDLLFTYSQIGPEVWKKFSNKREEKLWFEEEMLKMFKETWSHPLIDEYERLMEQMRKTQ
ncbi:MAG: HD domain-containing protein [Patescibacteria group bacterium]